MIRKNLLTFALTTSLLFPSVAFAVSPTPAPSPEPIDAAVLTTTAVPPRLEINVNPGETVQKTIKVQNSASVTQYYTSDVEDFVVGADGKTPLPLKDNISSRYNLSKWVTISPTRFVLKPNQTQVMDVLIQVPQDALPGGHYAMVLHQPDNVPHKVGEALVANGSTGTAMRIGSLLYVTVAGDVHEEAFIRNFKAPSFIEFGPVKMSFDVENRSDVHIRPQSSVEVKDIFGRVMEKTSVDTLNIFPYTTRGFNTQYGRYWGLGRYSAQLVVPYGTHGNMTQASVVFWIVPYRLIIAVIILLAAATAMFILLRRFFLHRTDAKTREIEALKRRIRDLEQK